MSESYDDGGCTAINWNMQLYFALPYVALDDVLYMF